MSFGHFVWTDLSTYDMPAARKDYSALFGWTFSGRGEYDFALQNDVPVAAIFKMPDFLAKIDMPSFWMSYVRVDDLDAKVEFARAFRDVIIELEPQAFNDDARVALVRDPSGAGFTLYEGPDITPPQAINTVVMRHHHVPDISLISDFYEEMFGWTMRHRANNDWPVFDVVHPDGSIVAQVEEVPEDIRGKFRYWMPCFEVSSSTEAVARIEAKGGKNLVSLGEDRSMFVDQQGAHFIVKGGGLQTERADPTLQRFPWKAAVGILFVWLAVIFEWQVFWGALFLIWTWPALKHGRADFVEPVKKHRHPALYWLIVGTWILLSVWMIWAAVGAWN